MIDLLIETVNPTTNKSEGNYEKITQHVSFYK